MPGHPPPSTAAATAAVLFGVVAVLLAGVGAVDKADHMTAWVIALCAEVPPDALFSVFHLPPPMDAWGLRPLSLAVMQVYLALVGTAPAPPVAVVGAKAAAGALALAWAGRAWLRAHGFAPVAEVAAVASLLSGAHLFSAWYLTEFDAWGAAATLGALALLRRPLLRPRRILGVVFLLAFAMLLKESSALLTLSFLGGTMAAALAQRRCRLAARAAAPAFLCALLWLALASPLLGSGAPTSMVGTAPASWRVPIIEHNLAQLVYLATPTGAVLIGLLGLQQVVSLRLRRRLPGLALWVLVFLPLVARYSHYETVYHAPHAVSLGLSAALLGGLMAAGLLTRHLGLATLCGCVLGGQIVMAAVVLYSSALREDVAARLFLSAAPLLFALAAATLADLWRTAAAPRAVVGVLVLALVWSPLAGAINQGALWRARQKVDRAGRAHLVANEPLDAGNAVLIFNNFQEWLGPEELALSPAAGVRFLPVPALLTRPTLPSDDMGWTGTPLDLQAHVAAGEPTWLYWLAIRSTMPPAANAALRGDLSWTRRPLGALTPLRMVARETSPLPDHNFAEDALLTTFFDGPTPLEQLAATTGQERFAATAPFRQLPTELLSVPRRLVSGVPLIEPYIAVARVVRLDP